jgi:transcriptional regulator
VAEKSDLLQGTLDLLILRTLSFGPRHGLGVARRIAQITGDLFQVKPGSLFPALHRLEERGWLKSSWGESEHRRRAKYYALTRSGARQLQAEEQKWNRVSRAIAGALQAPPEPEPRR